MKYLVSGSVLLGSLLLAGTAFAAEQGQSPWSGQGKGPVQGIIMRDGHASTTPPGVVGTVASVSGNTITVDSLMRKMGSDKSVSTTTYSVDATNAVIVKNNATSTVASVAVGDLVLVQGTVNGTTVAAKRIFDSLPPRPGMMGKDGDGKMFNGSTTPRGKTNIPMGNGQPLIGGNVTAVSGNTLTVTNKGGVTYTVDTTSAKISKHGVTSATVANIVVGDAVVVQGTFNGTSVTAALVVDQGVRPALDSTNMSGDHSTDNIGGERRSLMGAVGGFFSRLFGF